MMEHQSSLLAKAPFSSSNGIDQVSIYALSNPASGTNDIVVSGDLGTGTAIVHAVSYNGVAQQVPSNVASSTGFGTNVSYSLNVQGSNSWIAEIIANNSTAISLTSTGVVRQAVYLGRLQFDTNGVVPVGSNVITASLANGWALLHGVHSQLNSKPRNNLLNAEAIKFYNP